MIGLLSHFKAWRSSVDCRTEIHLNFSLNYYSIMRYYSLHSHFRIFWNPKLWFRWVEDYDFELVLTTIQFPTKILKLPKWLLSDLGFITCDEIRPSSYSTYICKNIQTSRSADYRENTYKYFCKRASTCKIAHLWSLSDFMDETCKSKGWQV